MTPEEKKALLEKVEAEIAKRRDAAIARLSSFQLESLPESELWVLFYRLNNDFDKRPATPTP
jgi:hypothetical protein